MSGIMRESGERGLSIQSPLSARNRSRRQGKPSDEQIISKCRVKVRVHLHSHIRKQERQKR
jgi:hypothetical protein